MFRRQNTSTLAMALSLALSVALVGGAPTALAHSPASATAQKPAPLAYAPGKTAETARFSVQVRGKAGAPDVVLVHGLSSSRSVWEPLAASLEGRFRVHVLQINGYDGTPVAGNATGRPVADTAEELAAYIKGAGLKKPALIGHSMGGTIGMMVAARHPDAISRLMVVDMVPDMYMFVLGPQASAEQVAATSDAMRKGMISASDEANKAQVTQVINGMVKTESARGPVLASALSSDRTLNANAYHELLNTRLSSELPAVTAPTTVLYAWHAGLPYTAQMADGWYKGAYMTLKGANLVRIDDSAHFIQIDARDRFHSEVETFLK